MKEGLATLIAEWDIIEGIESTEGKNKEKLNMRLTPEIVVLKIFRRISDEDVTFMGFSAIMVTP